MEKLQEDLLGEGIINSGVEKRTICMKEQFLSSETYQKGFVLTNRPIYRKKTTDEEIDTTFNKIIKASIYYKLSANSNAFLIAISISQ